VTKPDYDAAKARLDSTMAGVDNAKALLAEAVSGLDDCTLAAPFDSWVLKRNIEVGSLVQRVQPDSRWWTHAQ
jgi:multidrug resistance efflux pump